MLDGSNPYGGMLLVSNVLYGTTSSSSNGAGTVFAVNVDGTGFTNLYTFSGSDGANPYGGLVLDGKTLYGTTLNGGALNEGVVFALNLSVLPLLSIQHVRNAVILTWDDPSFVLQSAPAISGGYTNVPGAISPFTNSVASSQQFFRLQSQ